MGRVGQPNRLQLAMIGMDAKASAPLGEAADSSAIGARNRVVENIDVSRSHQGKGV